ncbi:hypothetical protein LCGC14_0906810 [marine sediment metagenome]|uniref:Uncharacterized protein n=1 Tax=marine sediment metagenome TaxID=412755 RepID=A0A0F9RDM7_9ZZZZ
MPPNEPPPLTESDCAMLEEVIDGFWEITVRTYRACTTPCFHIIPEEMSRWRTAYVSEMSTLLNSFIDQVTEELNARNPGSP